jgi:hypothetical protein
MTAVTPDQLQPGMFFLRHIEGWSGRVISAMQAFVRGGSYWTHAGLILSNGQYIQAQPHGAQIHPVETLFDGAPLLISDQPVQNELKRLSALITESDGSPHVTAGCGPCASNEQRIRGKIDVAGRALEHTPYSYLDYLAIGAVEFNWLGAQLLCNYVESSKHLICSALADRAFLNAGVHLFDDHPYRWYPKKSRLPGDVTPEDLAVYATSNGAVPLLNTGRK